MIPMSKLMMYAFDQASESGDAVAKALGIKKVAHEGSKFSGGPDYVVINWGSSNLPKTVKRCRVINSDSAVAKAINKKAFFQWVGDKARTVPWTTGPEVAKLWPKVVCRKRLEGKEGEGITIECPPMPQISPPSGILGWLATTLAGNNSVNPTPILSPAKLYTKFIEAKAEYRVHIVVSGHTKGNPSVWEDTTKAIAVHRKVDGTTTEVKNTANGWKFKRVSIYPDDIVYQAKKAVQAIGLDFAAVDVIWDGDKAWVLEANTAPGIYDMPWTLQQYAKALSKLTGLATT